MYDVAGKSIDKRACVDTAGALKDNIDSYPVTIREHGQGYLTSKCLEAGQTFGPKRDCEMKLSSRYSYSSCTAGKKIEATCSFTTLNTLPQVIRICEASTVLKAGTACRYMDDSMLSNAVMTSSRFKFNFTCPIARSANETGGRFTVYSGPVLNKGDQPADIICNFRSV